MTTSPILRVITPSPTLSTIAAASCPKIEGKVASELWPSNAETSVGHKAFAITFSLTSPAFGGATYISVTSKGALGAQAIAALHVIVFPFVFFNSSIISLWICIYYTLSC